MRAIILIIAFCSALGYSKCDQANHVKETYELAFAMDGEPLGPDNTYELLKTLEDMILTDSLGRKLKKELPKIRELIDAGNVNQEKCNLASIEHIGSLYDLNYEFATNVRPYLEHYRLKQFEVCKNIFASNMKQAVADLPYEAQTSGKLLRDTYLEANRGNADKMRYLRVESDALIEALVLYLGRQPFELITKDKISGAKGEDVFRKIFHHTVTDMCAKITDGLQAEYKLYNILLGEEDIVKLVDDETLGWVTVYRVCTFQSTQHKFFGDLRKAWIKKKGAFWGDF